MTLAEAVPKALTVSSITYAITLHNLRQRSTHTPHYNLRLQDPKAFRARLFA